MRKDRLDLFMNPRSVAIVGASRKSRRTGQLQPDRKHEGLRLRGEDLARQSASG